MKKILIIESIILAICISILGKIYNKYSYFLLLKPYDLLNLNTSFEHKLYQIDNLCSNLEYFTKNNEKIEKELFKGYMKGLGDKYADYLTPEEYKQNIISHSASIATISQISDKIIYNIIDNDIGFITIKGFYSGIADKFIEIIDKLDECNGIIIDLRNNGGGNVSDCLKMLDYLIEEPKQVELSLGNLLYYELNRDDNIINQSIYYTKDNHSYNKPIIILVSKDTASASELFCQCLRDYDKCKIIGLDGRTYGKAVEQMTYPLSDGSAIKLTTTVYRTPSRYNIQGNGLTPDYIISNELDQLELAIKLIRGDK